VPEAADRAGTIVAEQVASIMHAAETKAFEIQSGADEDATAIRQQAAESARRVLERIDSMEQQLGEIVASLRREAESLLAEADTSRGH